MVLEPESLNQISSIFLKDVPHLYSEFYRHNKIDFAVFIHSKEFGPRLSLLGLVPNSFAALETANLFPFLKIIAWRLRHTLSG